MKQKVMDSIDKNKKWLLKTLGDVVSRNTINKYTEGNENEGQDLIENIFKEMNLKIDRFSPNDVNNLTDHPAFLQGRNYKNRDNVVGFIGNEKGKTLIFSSHIDTVPTKEQKWSKTAPLCPKIIANKLYGLGALDMKGGLAASIFALKILLDLGININGKVILESVVDEEYAGANGTLACILRGYEGDLAIIPEPTAMKICPVSISQTIYEISLKGSKGINLGGSKEPLKNPIFLAAKLINVLADYEKYLNSQKSKYKLFKDYDKPIFFICPGIRSGEVGPEKLFTTPSLCKLNISIRNYYGISEKEFEDQLFDFLNNYSDISEELENKNIVFKKYYRYLPGSEYNFDTNNNKFYLTKLIEAGKRYCNRKLIEIGSDFGGDLFMFNDYSNTPAVFFGPGGANAHSGDEYVNIDDLIDISKIYAALIYDCCCV